MHISNVLIF